MSVQWRRVNCREPTAESQLASRPRDPSPEFMKNSVAKSDQPKHANNSLFRQSVIDRLARNKDGNKSFQLLSGSKLPRNAVDSDDESDKNLLTELVDYSVNGEQNRRASPKQTKVEATLRESGPIVSKRTVVMESDLEKPISPQVIRQSTELRAVPLQTAKQPDVPLSLDKTASFRLPPALNKLADNALNISLASIALMLLFMWWSVGWQERVQF